jgi:hypothetical protein
MSEEKKKNRRGPFPGIDVSKHPRTRREYIDFDYADKLSPEEKKFLSNFSEEYYGGGFAHDGIKHHKTKKSKRECYTRNNRQNRDVTSISRGIGWMSNVDDNVDAIDRKQYTNPAITENISLDVISIKNLIIRIACLSAKKKK